MNNKKLIKVAEALGYQATDINGEVKIAVSLLGGNVCQPFNPLSPENVLLMQKYLVSKYGVFGFSLDQNGYHAASGDFSTLEEAVLSEFDEMIGANE